MTWAKQGFVAKIDSKGLNSGPGTRTVVFFGGCPLRCAYCDHPDLWKVNQADQISVDKLYDKISNNESFIDKQGGVTISGGEPLSQPQFLISFLKKCKENKIHTTLDTAGFGNIKNFDLILTYVDLVIFDLKEPDPFAYPKLTGVVKRISDSFVEVVENKEIPMWIRTVIVPGHNDTFEKMDELAFEINKLKHVQKVELLPYHKLGVSKYADLALDYKLEAVEAMDENSLSELSKYLNKKLKIYR